MSKNSGVKTEENISELGNVDQIREILFGSQSRELSRKFEKIENSINLSKMKCVQRLSKINMILMRE